MATSSVGNSAAAKVPTSLREYLTLMEAMREGVAAFDIDDFYFLSRATLVKDERYLDRFDRVFGQCFKGLETPTDPAKYAWLAGTPTRDVLLYRNGDAVRGAGEAKAPRA